METVPSKTLMVALSTHNGEIETVPSKTLMASLSCYGLFHVMVFMWNTKMEMINSTYKLHTTLDRV